MTRAALPAAVPVALTGLLLAGTTPDAANGNLMKNNGGQFLHVKNGDSGSHTVTIKAFPAGNTPAGLVVTDLAVVVAAGVSKLIGPFPPSVFNDANGNIWIDYDAATAMLVEPISFASNPN